MTETTDLLVFWTVVLGRFFIPLLIPRYPLPAIVAALVLDGVDQTIFQTFTNLPLEGYQGYDKALDIYYLTVAYISTLRNWQHRFAFQMSRFLWYYRLVGVTLFELTHLRPLLLIFPNTFEYFFIFYEAVRMRWDPLRMGTRLVIGAAAFIWIFIKLPQEWWIHIAQLDATDFIKESIFGVPVNASWIEAIAARPWIVVLAVVVIGLLLFLAWWLIIKKLPPADWKLKLAADPLPEDIDEAEERRALIAGSRVASTALLEKVVLVALVSIIFAQVLPEVRASDLQIAVGVGVVVTVNAFLSHWLAQRGRGIESTLRHFLVMAVVNFGLVLTYAFLLPNFDGSINLTNTLFFALLLTLLVTLFDRYHPVHVVRFA